MPIEADVERQESEQFDAAAYVDGIWESEVRRTILENAVDLSTLLEEILIVSAGLAGKDESIEIAS